MPCPLCGLSEKTDIGRKGPSFYVECLACGLVSIRPHPTDAELKEFYRDYVYHHRVKNPGAKSLRFRSKVLPLKLMAKGNRFLDIGCNVGSFVAAAHRLGCEAYGIDVSPNAINHAKQLWPGCNFFNETLEEFSIRGITFDMVVCTEVIEHVRDLHRFMRSLRAVLNPGALLFFTTPDTGHFRTPKKRFLDWKEVRPLEHVALFNRRNIRMLFEKYDILPFLFFPMHRANIRFYSRYSP